MVTREYFLKILNKSKNVSTHTKEVPVEVHDEPKAEKLVDEPVVVAPKDEPVTGAPKDEPVTGAPKDETVNEDITIDELKTEEVGEDKPKEIKKVKRTQKKKEDEMLNGAG